MGAEDPSTWKPEKRLEHYKERAEWCYGQMYDCARHNLKDFKDDALYNLARASEAAQELGRHSELKEIEKKGEHISAVYRQLGG
jgi:hypothetical protein